MKFTKFIVMQTQENNPKKSLKREQKEEPQERTKDTQMLKTWDFANK